MITSTIRIGESAFRIVYIEWECAFAVATYTGCINGSSTFGERYNAQHHELPIKSYKVDAMWQWSIALLRYWYQITRNILLNSVSDWLYTTQGKRYSRLYSPRTS